MNASARSTLEPWRRRTRFVRRRLWLHADEGPMLQGMTQQYQTVHPRAIGLLTSTSQATGERTTQTAVSTNNVTVQVQVAQVRCNSRIVILCRLHTNNLSLTPIRVSLRVLNFSFDH